MPDHVHAQRSPDRAEILRNEYDELLNEALAIQARFDKAAEAGYPEAVQHFTEDAERLLQQRVELLRQMGVTNITTHAAIDGARKEIAAVAGVFDGVPPAIESDEDASDRFERLRREAVERNGFAVHRERHKAFDERYDDFNEEGRELFVVEKNGITYYIEHDRVPHSQGAMFGRGRIRYFEATRLTGYVKKNRWVNIHLTLKRDEVFAKFDEGTWERMCTDPEIQKDIDRLIATIE